MGSPIYTSGHIPGREIPPSLINARSEPLSGPEGELHGGVLDLEGLDFKLLLPLFCFSSLPSSFFF